MVSNSSWQLGTKDTEVSSLYKEEITGLADTGGPAREQVARELKNNTACAFLLKYNPHIGVVRICNLVFNMVKHFFMSLPYLKVHSQHYPLIVQQRHGDRKLGVCNLRNLPHTTHTILNKLSRTVLQIRPFSPHAEVYCSLKTVWECEKITRPWHLKNVNRSPLSIPWKTKF